MNYEKYLTPEIKISCCEDKVFKSEVRFDHHMLVWFISGESRIVLAEASYTFGPGDIFLLPRHQLANSINYPKDGLPHQVVVLYLTTARLRAYYAALPHRPDPGPVPLGIQRLGQPPLLAGYLSSLLPHFSLNTLPEDLATLKILEAIELVRASVPAIDHLLANFEELGKVDLAAYMEKNFMFNLPLAKFSFLTGRSLSTFKRDFQRVFGTTPQRWLTRKRLALAHFLLAEQGKRPSEVYFEVGFEDLSHFSYAFKKQYGYAPRILAT